MVREFFKAVEFYKIACDTDYGMACNNLGVMYENGRGIKQDKHKAKALFGKACDLKNELGCKNYARLNEAGY